MKVAVFMVSSEAVFQRYSVKKVFLKISFNSEETTNFEKFLRTSFLIDPLQWLLLSVTLRSLFSSVRFPVILILTLIAWFYNPISGLSQKKIFSRIYSIRRSSRWFKAIFFLILSVDLLLALHKFSCVNGVFTKVGTIPLQSILVVGALVILLKWYSVTLNTTMTLLSTFHVPPGSHISICLSLLKKMKFSIKDFFIFCVV